jgi:hypothetical protein
MENSYVAGAGFGHEEWLFNLDWLIDGFHYAFLQPVHKSYKKVVGKTIDVLLYTIDPNGKRWYVGEISKCEVIQREQADKALEIYRNRGWLTRMKEQIKEAGGKVEYLDEINSPFNVRFRRSDLDIYDKLRIPDENDIVRGRSRNMYLLVPADDKLRKQWRRHSKTTPTSFGSVTRKGTPGSVYDPIHPHLQDDLFRLLKGRYGIGNVDCEKDYVDITVKDGNKTILIEIKTYPTPLAAIREAIGQLLEYAYYHGPQTGTVADELIVIAPGEINKRVEEYIHHLRTAFKIPISYCSHSEGDPLPDIFAKS